MFKLLDLGALHPAVSYSLAFVIIAISAIYLLDLVLKNMRPKHLMPVGLMNDPSPDEIIKGFSSGTESFPVGIKLEKEGTVVTLRARVVIDQTGLEPRSLKNRRKVASDYQELLKKKIS